MSRKQCSATFSMSNVLPTNRRQRGAIAIAGFLLSFPASGWAGEPIRSERPFAVSVLVDGSGVGADDTVFGAGPHLTVNLGSHLAVEAFATTSFLVRSTVGAGARAYLLASNITPFADVHVAHVHYTFDGLLGGSSGHPNTSLYLGAGLAVASRSGFEISIGGGGERFLDSPEREFTTRVSLTMGWRF